MSQLTKKNTRANPEVVLENPPEQEDLKAFIHKCVTQSQAVLMERISGLEKTIGSLKNQHEEAIENLAIKHAEEMDSLKASLMEKIDNMEEVLAKEKSKNKTDLTN